ncbi:troponin C, skeletal muscle [Aplysia californica]|uniref:Troponin C, skeletal muscle n=1 Tax=Aplysia californica TaxID=6500 RepID=A0ABM1AE73_APLCA|nr:troponin C, skeletal muscle [Aplysia californica]
MLTSIDRNEASGVKLLNLGNTKVFAKFKTLQDKLEEERDLKVLHGGVLDEVKKEVVEIDPMEAFLRDPFTKLKEWVARAGYRLIDLLRHFDKDQSMTISIEEFREGIEATSIPITEEQIQILVARLDQDGDGEIDFRLVLSRGGLRVFFKILHVKMKNNKDIHMFTKFPSSILSICIPSDYNCSILSQSQLHCQQS